MTTHCISSVGKDVHAKSFPALSVRFHRMGLLSKCYISFTTLFIMDVIALVCIGRRATRWCRSSWHRTTPCLPAFSTECSRVVRWVVAISLCTLFVVPRLRCAAQQVNILCTVFQHVSISVRVLRQAYATPLLHSVARTRTMRLTIINHSARWI